MNVVDRISALFQPRSCPVKPSAAPRRPLRARHFGPLAGFIVPTVVVGYDFVIPRSCIAGVNELTVGFATTLIGAAATYVMGVRSALANDAERSRNASA